MTARQCREVVSFVAEFGESAGDSHPPPLSGTPRTENSLSRGSRAPNSPLATLQAETEALMDGVREATRETLSPVSASSVIRWTWPM
jgi:hypothetical protein